LSKSFFSRQIGFFWCDPILAFRFGSVFWTVKKTDGVVEARHQALPYGLFTRSTNLCCPTGCVVRQVVLSDSLCCPTACVVRQVVLSDRLCRTTQSVGRHNLSDDTICQTTQISVGQHKYLSDITNICRTSQISVGWHKFVSHDRKFVFCVNAPLPRSTIRPRVNVTILKKYFRP
jgi:hypothetical protein